MIDNKEYEPYKYGLSEFKYMPTMCLECNRVLTHTFIRENEHQPEISFQVICNHCFIKYKRLSPNWK